MTSPKLTCRYWLGESILFSAVSGEGAMEHPQTELATKAAEVKTEDQYERCAVKKWTADWTLLLTVPSKVK